MENFGIISCNMAVENPGVLDAHVTVQGLNAGEVLDAIPAIENGADVVFKDSPIPGAGFEAEGSIADLIATRIIPDPLLDPDL